MWDVLSAVSVEIGTTPCLITTMNMEHIHLPFQNGVNRSQCQLSYLHQCQLLNQFQLLLQSHPIKHLQHKHNPFKHKEKLRQSHRVQAHDIHYTEDHPDQRLVCTVDHPQLHQAEQHYAIMLQGQAPSNLYIKDQSTMEVGTSERLANNFLAIIVVVHLV